MRKCSLKNCEKNNLRIVRKNWLAISEALKLVYGDLKKSTNSPWNRHIVMRMYRFIRSVVFGGPTSLKTFAHSVRLKLTAGTGDLANRGKTPQRLMIASTLTRGLILPKPRREEVEDECRSASLRLQEPSPMPPKAILDKLKEFIEKVFKGKSLVGLDERTIPIPGGSACYEQSIQKGGSAYVYKMHTQRSRSEREHDARARAITRMTETWSKVSFETNPEIRKTWDFPIPWGDQEEITEEYIRECTNGLWDSHPGLISEERRALMFTRRRRTAAEHFRACIEESKNSRFGRLAPIITPDGKIRVATVHSAPVAWAARAMTKCLLPLLKGFAVTKDILRNNEIELVAPAIWDADPKIVYSADLSKSTDPISVDLSRFVLNEVTNITGKPEWWDDALAGTINFHEIDFPNSDEKFISRCGALMGLGPGWFVLCVVNAFCAYLSGASKRSFAVCGDDLIGLWPKRVADAYEENLRVMGLVPNTSKSFRSESYGVFCERLVERRGNIARSQALLRIGEATAAKARAQLNELSVVDTLTRSYKNEVLSSLAQRVARGFAFPDTIPGPLGSGGGGVGKATVETVISYIKFGPLSLNRRSVRKADDDEVTQLRSSLRLLEPSPGSTTISTDKVLIEAQRMQNAAWNAKHGAVRPPPEKRTRKDIRHELAKRARVVRNILSISEGRNLKAVRLAISDKPYILPRRRLLCQLERLTRAQRWDLCLAHLSKSWDVNVRKEEALACLKTTIKASKTQFEVTNLNLKPTLGAWDVPRPTRLKTRRAQSTAHG
jgi:hypothetical protein